MLGIRSFVAIDPSAEVLARLIELHGELAGLGADVRWVRQDGLHCTVKFLGEVEETRLEAACAALREALAGTEPFMAQVRGLGVFPSWRRPGVVWVGLHDADTASASFARLAARIDTALAPLGFAPESRPFRAHITLGRVRGRKGWAPLAENLRAREQEHFGESAVSRLVVYRSELRPTGSVYTELRAMPLGGGTRDEGR